MLLCIDMYITSTAHSSQFKNEIESDIVPLQTNTLCEVVKSIKQKSRKSDASHPASMNMMWQIASLHTKVMASCVFFYTFNVWCVQQLSPLVRCVLCCRAPSLFETSVSTFPNFHDTPPHKKQHYHTSVQMQDITAVSKVLHNLAISLVLTTSSINKLHTLYTPGPIHSNIYHGNHKWA